MQLEAAENLHTIHLNVSTFQCETKSRLLILDKVQSYFGVAFLLQVRNDGLSNKLGIAHHVQHLIILAVDKCQLELVLGGVDAENTRTTFAVQAVDVVSFDTGHVDRQIQRSNNAVVTTSVTTHYSQSRKFINVTVLVFLQICRKFTIIQVMLLLVDNMD